MKDISQTDLEQRLKLSSAQYSGHKSVVEISTSDGISLKIGYNNFVVMAGPCAIETEEQIYKIADAVKQRGAHILRGGAFKPITFPGVYKELGEEGLKYLRGAGDRFGMPVVSEVLDPRQVDIVSKYVDILQIGARNMQNFPLLKEVGKTGKPVLLKRHPGMSLRDLLGAAEWIMYQGNEKVILCERGISAPHTHHKDGRFLPDIMAIPALNEYSHLPVFFDPSHSTFRQRYVPAMSRAAIAAGADGLIIDVHYDPPNAHVDPLQALDYDAFERLIKEMKDMAKAIGKEL